LEGPLKSLPEPSFLEGLEGAPALLLGSLKARAHTVRPSRRPGATLPHRRPSSCPTTLSHAVSHHLDTP
jgi:hypothetical protein